MHLTRNGFTMTFDGENLLRACYPILGQQFCDTILFDRANDRAMARESVFVNQNDVAIALSLLFDELHGVVLNAGARMTRPGGKK